MMMPMLCESANALFRESLTVVMQAFKTCAQSEPENGEAWNNLAALWMRQKKPDRALWALKEAVKHKHSSWETWENYAKVQYFR